MESRLFARRTLALVVVVIATLGQISASADVVVELVANVATGRVVREISAYGPRVAWNEGSAADSICLEYNDETGQEEYYGYVWNEDGGWSGEANVAAGPVSYSLREWDGGYLGAIVAEEDLILNSTFMAPAFRPLVTGDGTYYLTQPERWRGEYRYRDLGGNTIVAHDAYFGTCIGEYWSYREMESGRVLGAWNEDRWSGGVPRKVVDLTHGAWNVIAEPEYAGWDGDWGTTYWDVSPFFLPNALSWQSADCVLTDETGYDTTRLVVLPDDGSDTPVVIDGATNATLCARGGDGSLLWEEMHDDHTVLVFATRTGDNWDRRTVHVPRRFDAGPLITWEWDEATKTSVATTNESERVLSSPDMNAGLTASGQVFYECLNDSNTAKELVICGAGSWDSPEVLDSVAWSESEPDFGARFSALPYRSGLAWLHPTGATNENGLALADLRVSLGGETFTATSNVLPSGEATGISDGGGFDSNVIFSRAVCATNRLAFERWANGAVQLCVWDGDSAAIAPTVLASGYETMPHLALNVNARGAAAAVNMGTSDNPDYKVYVAYETGDAPVVNDLAAGTELVPYSAQIGAPGSAMSFVAGSGQGFGLDPATGCLTGRVARAGTYCFRIATDGVPGSHGAAYRLAVAENPNRPPVVDSATPSDVIVNFGAATQVAFSVVAHDPEGGALSYRWFVDGEEQSASSASFTLTRAAGDVTAHNVRCVVEDDLWTASSAGADATAVKWAVGVLAVQSASASEVHVGQRATLSVILESTIDFYGSGGLSAGYDATTWYDAATDEQIAVGNVVSAPADGSGTYYAVSHTRYGTVRTGDIAVTFDPSPAVGRICKRTGPALIGNRCVLHAGAWGEGTLSFSWTRDGAVVATTQTLDIPALSASDFGTYVLTVGNAHGEATSVSYILEPAPVGTVVGWRNTEYVNINALPPEGLSNVVQIAALPWGGVALRAEGTVASWCDLDTGLSDVPAGMTGVVSVAASHGSAWRSGIAAAILRDGTVTTWGRNYQLARDYVPDDETGRDIESWTLDYEASSPDPSSLSNVVQVAIGKGGEWNLALHADGTVTLWGADNWVEGLGWIDGPFSIPLTNIFGAVSVQMGPEGEGYILLDDGTLVGENGVLVASVADWPNPRAFTGSFEEDWCGWILVDETGGVHSSPVGSGWDPVDVEILDGAVAADKQSDYGRAMVLDEDGIVYECYYGGHWVAASNVVQISCGAAHTLALRRDGTVPVPGPLPDGNYRETVDGVEWMFTITNGEAFVVNWEVFDNTWLDASVKWNFTEQALVAWQNGITNYAAIAADTAGDIVVPDMLGGCPVAGIGPSAFLECNGITSLTIPATATNNILTGAEMNSRVDWFLAQSVYGCRSLVALNVADGNPIYSSANGVLFDKSGETLLFLPYGWEGAYEVPEGVVAIEYFGICECFDLTSLYIPDSVTNVSVNGVCDNGSALSALSLPAHLGDALEGGYSAPIRVPVTCVVTIREAAPDPESEFKAWLVENNLASATATATEIDALRAIDDDGDGFTAYDEYVAGTDPNDVGSRFIADIAIVNGKVEVTWNPNLGDKRTYTILHAETLDGQFVEIDGDDIPAGARGFFKVKVTMPSR